LKSAKPPEDSAKKNYVHVETKPEEVSRPPSHKGGESVVECATKGGKQRSTPPPGCFKKLKWGGKIQSVTKKTKRRKKKP